jgi:lipoate-protein ligase A
MEFSRTKWRLIHTLPSTGAWNMAVDEAILEAVGRGDVLPTLRLFAWNPPCLSLGYAQSIADVDRERLTKHGWHLVRRPTGGKAILHTDELTYTVVAPHSEPRLAGGILESYQRLSLALLEALKTIGISAQSLEKPSNRAGQDEHNPVCFELPSNYEITVAGKKIIGSAQARRQAGILQHGSLPLYGDITRITDAVNFPNDKSREQATERLRARATTAEEILGYRVDWAAAAQAFATAFREMLNLDLLHAELSPTEQERAMQLVQEKYDHLDWTERI